MGFWSSFFGVGAAHVMRDIEQDKKNTQKWNDLFHELGEYETRFQNYLKSIGCPGVYIADVEHVNNGNIMPEIRKMDNLRKKVDEYISIGGDARILLDIDNIDEYIDKVKYLRSIGELERQYEFRNNNRYYIQNKISVEKEELEKQQKILRQQELEIYHNQIAEMLGTDINNLSGVEFENICQQLVENMGFKTETTKASGDGGIDLISYNKQPLLSGKYIIQCKRYSGSVGEPIIRDLYGVVTSERANKGILMTTGYFTKSAISFAEGKPIELIDGQMLNKLFEQYGLLSETQNSEINDNFIKENLFDIEDFLQYDWFYDEYAQYVENVKNDGGDLRSRCKIIEILKEEISSRIYEGIASQYDIYCAIEILESYLCTIIKSYNRNSSNKKLKYIYYMSLLIEAECATWKGNFTKSIINYERVMSEWSDFTNGDNDIYNVEVVLTMCTILNILNLPECVDILRSRYNNLIQSQIQYFYEDKDNSEYSKDQYRKLIDKYGIHDVITLSLWDLSGDSVLYDLGIDDWGDIKFSSGICHVNIDNEKDCIYFWLKDAGTNVKKGINLVYGLSEKIESNRESVRALF